jgi:ectoine hydroxylase-related dioxygenase (phytanoyl-CoA dioxygenase family)
MNDKQLFDNNGYIVFDTKIEESLLESIKNTVVHSNDERVQDAWKDNIHVKEIALHPNIINKIYEIYNEKPLPFQTLNFKKGTQQKAHSDTIHFNSSPKNNMCGVWIALENIDMNNGPLFYHSGSHKDETYCMQDFNLEPIVENYREYEQHLSRQIIKKGYMKRHATIQKGHAVIWAANLLHGGETVKDKTITRYSQATHYFFESDLYYTPMLSSVNNLCIRKPNWIF